MKDLECEFHEIPEVRGVAAIDLSGGIFASNMNELTDLIDEQQAGGNKDLILNLRNLDFISSSGIGLIVQKHEEFRKIGKRFWVAGLNPDIAKIFDQLSLEEIINIVPDAQEAIAKIRRATI
jgi:anti-sigma B factor antagonist